MPTVVCTTVNKKNLQELQQLKNVLVEKSVQRWQFQIGMPMGNMLNYPELILNPEDLEELINFCHQVMKDGDIIIDIAHDIGYYSEKDVELRKESNKGSDGIWRGCCAGKEVVGIRANGDICGCLSIRDDDYIEGNIRTESLFDMWHRSDAFAWNRDLTSDKLTKFCAECQYGSICKGGCAASKIIMCDATTHNDYCLFRVMVLRAEKNASNMDRPNALISKARQLISSQHFQFANVYLERVLEIDPNHIEALKLLGYAQYNMGHYEVSKQYNQSVLKINPDDAYALNGYGLCLDKFGKFNEAVASIQRAIDVADNGFTDPVYDLETVLSRSSSL